MLRRRVAAAALCAVAAVSLAGAPGCAETDELSDRLSKAQYLLEMRAVVAEVRQTLRRLTEFDQFPSPAQIEALLDKSVAEFGRVVRRMESIDPPEEVADLHHRLTDTLAGAQLTLERANRSLRSGDVGGLLGLSDDARGLVQELGDVTVDYAERGYELEGKGGAKGVRCAPSGAGC